MDRLDGYRLKKHGGPGILEPPRGAILAGSARGANCDPLAIPSPLLKIPRVTATHR
jgi:hypothetical protein